MSTIVILNQLFILVTIKSLVLKKILFISVNHFYLFK